MVETNIIDWDLCEREFIRKVNIDNERAKSMVRKALQRLERARKTEISLENISFVVEDYYEVVKELLIVYLLKNGLRSKNHQCLISYFYRENPDIEKKELGVKLGEMLGVKLNENESEILRRITENKFVTALELSNHLRISVTAIENNISRLKQKGLLKRVGPDRGGYWEIKNKDKK